MENTLSKRFFVLLIVLTSTVPRLPAQDSSYSATASVTPTSGIKQFRTLSVGINAGLLAPVAGIGGSNDFTKWTPTFGYGFNIKNQFTHNIALQVDFLRGNLKANNDKELGNGTHTTNPYNSFKTEVHWAASLSGVFTFGNINWLSDKNCVVPYISAGAGLASYNPTLNSEGDGTSIDYKPDGTINEFFVPVGGGLKIGLSPGMNLDLGYRMHFVDGDNLDGYNKEPQKDKFSYGFAGLEFAIGDKTKPQLMMNNPVSKFRQDLMDQNNAMKASLTASQQETQQKVAVIGSLQQELAQLKKDSDGDGVSDYFDKCASTPANEKVDGSGCPLPKPEVTVIKEQPKITITEEDRRIVREAFENLEFDFGKATIRSKSYPTLDKVAELLVKKNFSLKLSGHTDNVGTESANLKLSKDRAESVKAYLVSRGANPSRIEATGYGETQPIATNKTAAGRQKNRRVEFTLY